MDWLHSMTTQLTVFDILVIVLLLAFLARGLWIGFIRQASVLIAMVVGFVVASQLHADFYHLALPYLHNTQLTFLVSYIFLFVIIYLAIVLIGVGLKKVVTLSLLVWFDRTLGGLFGLGKGLFIASLLVMVLGTFLSGSNRLLRDAVCYPLLESSANLILTLVKDEELRSGFQLKEPAIPPFTPPPAGEETRPAQPEPPPDRPSGTPASGIFL